VTFSVATEFVVDVAGVEANICMCDVASVVAEFMVDVARVEANICAS
jgi:hypothetical protein